MGMEQARIGVTQLHLAILARGGRHHLEYRRTLRAPMQRFQCLALGPSEETKEKSERARVPAKNAKNDDQGTAASAKNPNMNGFERLSHSLGDWGTPAWGECSANDERPYLFKFSSSLVLMKAREGP